MQGGVHLCVYPENMREPLGNFVIENPDTIVGPSYTLTLNPDTRNPLFALTEPNTTPCTDPTVKGSILYDIIDVHSSTRIDNQELLYQVLEDNLDDLYVRTILHEQHRMPGLEPETADTITVDTVALTRYSWASPYDTTPVIVASSPPRKHRHDNERTEVKLFFTPEDTQHLIAALLQAEPSTTETDVIEAIMWGIRMMDGETPDLLIEPLLTDSTMPAEKILATLRELKPVGYEESIFASFMSG